MFSVRQFCGKANFLRDSWRIPPVEKVASDPTQPSEVDFPQSFTWTHYLNDFVCSLDDFMRRIRPCSAEHAGNFSVDEILRSTSGARGAGHLAEISGYICQACSVYDLIFFVLGHTLQAASLPVANPFSKLCFFVLRHTLYWL